VERQAQDAPVEAVIEEKAAVVEEKQPVEQDEHVVE